MGQVCQASISARKTYCSSGVIRMEGWEETLRYHLGFFGIENQDRVSRELASQEARC